MTVQRFYCAPGWVRRPACFPTHGEGGGGGGILGRYLSSIFDGSGMGATSAQLGECGRRLRRKTLERGPRESRHSLGGGGDGGRGLMGPRGPQPSQIKTGAGLTVLRRSPQSQLSRATAPHGKYTKLYYLKDSEPESGQVRRPAWRGCFDGGTNHHRDHRWLTLAATPAGGCSIRNEAAPNGARKRRNQFREPPRGSRGHSRAPHPARGGKGRRRTASPRRPPDRPSAGFLCTGRIQSTAAPPRLGAKGEPPARFAKTNAQIHRAHRA